MEFETIINPSSNYHIYISLVWYLVVTLLIISLSQKQRYTQQKQHRKHNECKPSTYANENNANTTSAKVLQIDIKANADA